MMTLKTIVCKHSCDNCDKDDMDDKFDEKTLVRTRNLSLHLEKIPLPCCHTRPCNVVIISITINLIRRISQTQHWNDLPKWNWSQKDQGIQHLQKGKLRAWYSILNIYKAALYNIYYKRLHNLDGYTILNKFRELLKTVKTIAAERGSSDMKHISLPSFSLSKYCPYQEIYMRVIEDTEDFRREDRKLGLRLPRDLELNTDRDKTMSEPSQNRNVKFSSEMPWKGLFQMQIIQPT